MRQRISRRAFNQALFAAGLTAGLGVGVDMSSAQEKVLRFGHMWPADSGWGQASQKFADLVKEKTAGAVTVTVYPNGQLGGEREMFESLSLGNLDVTFGGPGVLTNFDPKIGIFDMPFLFHDYVHANAVMDGPIGAAVFESLRQSSGIRVLASGAQGFRYIMTASKPIGGLGDIAGMKIRVPEAETFLQTFRLIGANPVSIPWGETYLAVQSGVADGLEGVPEVLMNFKMYEVGRNVARTNHILATLQLLVSDQMFSSLTAEQQQAVQQAATEAWNAQREAAQQQNEKAEKDLEGLGVAFTAPDLTPFREAVRPYWNEWAEEAGAQEQLAAIQAQ
jgi:tripartite ATP-independent transporter DctP family solute receptor